MKVPPWKRYTTSSIVVRRWDRTLMVAFTSYNRGSWNVLAIEGDAAATSAEDVFKDHAHKAIGEFTSERAARKAGERFALDWMAYRSDLSDLPDRCACEEIQPHDQARPEAGRAGRGSPSSHSGSGAEPQHAPSCPRCGKAQHWGICPCARCGVVHLDRCAP